VNSRSRSLHAIAFSSVVCLFCLIDPSAAEFRRRRQPEACRAAAAGKNLARRQASRNL